VEDRSTFSLSARVGVLIWFVAAVTAMFVILDWGGPLGLLPWGLLLAIIVAMPHRAASGDS
jgi:hypothetical protein